MATVPTPKAKRRSALGSLVHRDGWTYGVVTLQSGKRQWSPRFKTDAAAKRWQIETLHDDARGVAYGDPRRTVEQWMEWWLEQVVRPGEQKPTTYQSYASRVRQHIIPALGQVRVRQLSAQHVQAFITSLKAKRLAPGTVHGIGKILRAALTQAVVFKVVPTNVATAVKLPDPKSKKVRPLSIAQTETLLDGVVGHEYEALYTLAAQLGLRPGETLGIRWADVDFDAGTVAITATLNRLSLDPTAPRGGRTALVRQEQPKSEESERTRVMPTRSREALLAHRTRQLKARLAFPGDYDDAADLVFARADGSALDSSTVRSAFHRLLDDLGLPRVKLHDLRHGTVSGLIARNVNMKVISNFVGHKKIETTMNIYGHLLDEHHAGIAALLDAEDAARRA